MSTRAVVLGVAQDGGHPQPGCRRPCCSDTTGHNTTCVGIVDGDRAWLLDAGPDFVAHLDLLGKTDLQGIFLTHGHIGHYTGLMYLGREAMNTLLLPVWAAPRLADFLAKNGPWEQLVAAGNIDLRTMPPGDKVALSPQVSVQSFPVPHRGEYSETVGYRVTGPERTLIYVPDTDSWDGWESPVEAHISDCDIALVDGAFFDTEELPDRDMAEIAHPLVTDSLKRFSALDEADRTKIRFTHLNHTNPLLDRSSTASTMVARAGMAVATEGDIIDL